MIELRGDPVLPAGARDDGASRLVGSSSRATGVALGPSESAAALAFPGDPPMLRKRRGLYPFNCRLGVISQSAISISVFRGLRV